MWIKVTNSSGDVESKQVNGKAAAKTVRLSIGSLKVSGKFPANASTWASVSVFSDSDNNSARAKLSLSLYESKVSESTRLRKPLKFLYKW